MVYDTIIIGGGVSGLMTAYCLTLQKRRVLVVERGHQFYERNHNNPFDVANGIGGGAFFGRQSIVIPISDPFMETRE